MRPEELRRNDGREGRPAYIAYKGLIYDVTGNPNWEEGEHMGRLQAGRDLTPFLKEAPHGEEVFESLPVVGELESRTEESTPPAQAAKHSDLKTWYRKYHPHPMTVHFPIALHFFAAGMDLFFLFDPTGAYEIAVFYSFFAATVMGAVAMLPGLLSWGINYDFSKATAFLVKLYVSVFSVIIGAVAIYIRMEYPTIAYDNGFLSCFYHGTVFGTVVCVIILGYYGGKISWSGR
jgi:predicted heme/steroid binding protein/uncharacterized membrane protein